MPKNTVQLPVEKQIEVPAENKLIQKGSKKQDNAKSRSILALSHKEAREFLLKGESYCNFDLPPYIVFTKILSDISFALNGKEISRFRSNGVSSRDFDDLNHVIFNNKDGKYAWRPLQLIHPALYVSLVHKITEQNHWEKIQVRFIEFSRNQKIKCFRACPHSSISVQNS